MGRVWGAGGEDREDRLCTHMAKEAANKAAEELRVMSAELQVGPRASKGYACMQHGALLFNVAATGGGSPSLGPSII